jgi:hypothetical protein
MSTRSGDLDPGRVSFMARTMKKVIVAAILVIVLGITFNYLFKANAQMGQDKIPMAHS